MATTIYKYKAENYWLEIKLPINANIIDVEFQGNDLFFWAIVDTEDILESRKIVVFLTGQEIDSCKRLKHLKTLHDNGFVYHVFERLL